MSSTQHSLSVQRIEVKENTKIAIVCTRWNEHIISPLLKGALSVLKQNHIKEDNICVQNVPGSFELIHAVAALERTQLFDAIIAIGCVIKGDTPHFDYICEGVTQEIARMNANTDTPIIFGLLTTNNEQQALDRAGGAVGNKGEEFAQTALEMCYFKEMVKKMHE